VSAFGPIVISNVIHKRERRNRLQAAAASLALHAALFGALISLPEATPPIIALEHEMVAISLAGYAPVHAPSAVTQKNVPEKTVQPSKPAPKKVVAREAKPVPKPVQKPAPVHTALSEPKPVKAPEPMPVVAPTPEIKAPNPDPAPLSEALPASPSQTVTSAASAHSPTPELTYNDLSDSASPKTGPTGPDATVLGRIRAMIEAAITYPAVARRLRLEGVVTLSFMLAPDGAVASAEVLHSSGSALLDRKAIETLWELSGDFPSLETETQLTIPIAFSLNHS